MKYYASGIDAPSMPNFRFPSRLSLLVPCFQLSSSDPVRYPENSTHYPDSVSNGPQR